MEEAESLWTMQDTMMSKVQAHIYDENMMCPCVDVESDPNLYLTLDPNSNSSSNSSSNSAFTYDRKLTSDLEEDEGSLWQIVYTSFVLLSMFIALISDRIGADLVMTGALTLLLASSIISVPEALAGFANEGLLTVLVLFVVAVGISHTGALDWYMGKLLGSPTTEATAQLRLMLPIALVSGFLNNTPVVAVMIPIVQRWGKGLATAGVTGPRQLLVPLSFASILGGTCTLIRTSTNLVVVGLLRARYGPDDDVGTVGLFDLGLYGVPIALVGMSYILLASLEDGREGSDDNDGMRGIVYYDSSEQKER